ncbi:MAG: hypothetical protein Q8J76_12970, partial [Desulfobulbaceae bacterium]|nr:hypothetical protein [Desulfobulbaceae bacterium]
DEWWHLTLQILSLPPQQVVWTLRESQFTGKELFTMDGDGRFVKALDFSVKQPASCPSGAGGGKTRPTLKRVK